MAVGLSALYAGRALAPRNIPGAYLCSSEEPTQGHNAAVTFLDTMKIVSHKYLQFMKAIIVRCFSTLTGISILFSSSLFFKVLPVFRDILNSKSHSVYTNATS
jgi:hypothetical protein